MSGGRETNSPRLGPPQPSQRTSGGPIVPTPPSFPPLSPPKGRESLSLSRAPVELIVPGSGPPLRIQPTRLVDQ